MPIRKIRQAARAALTIALNFCMRATVFRSILYLVIRLTKRLPDNKFKARVYNWTASLNWHDFVFPATAIDVGRTTLQLIPHSNEFDFAAIVYKKMNYEAEVYDFLDSLEEYECVIDIGANVGIFSLYMAQRFLRAQIYAFEPGRDAFSRFLNNIKANSGLESRIHPFFSAVGADAPTITFYTPEGHLTNSSLDVKFAERFGPVKRVIAQVAPKILFEELLHHRNRALVKIDAEGAEPAVLQQLRELIVAAQADLLIEVLPDYAIALQEHFDYFRVAGYFAYSLQSKGAVLMTELNASSRWRDWWFSKTQLLR
jgi:FkbM family methyltransferase